MVIQIKPIAEDIPYSNIFLYADSGTGKTVFAGSDAKVLFLAPENDGLLSAIRTNSKASKIDIRQWEDMREACAYLEQNPDVLADFDWLVVDSMTEMQDMAKRYILRMGAAEKVRKNQDPEKMHLDEYGILHTLVENMVRNLNDLPINLLWTATSKKVEDADANEFLVPDIQGKKEYGIAMKMASLMTSYGYMRVELHEVPDPTEAEPQRIKLVKRRVIYWEDTGTIRGKDRTTRLAPFTTNATLQKLRLTIKGTYVRQADGQLVKAGTQNAKAVAPTVVKTKTKAEKEAEKEAAAAKESEPTGEAEDQPRDDVQASPKPDAPVESEVQSNTVTGTAVPMPEDSKETEDVAVEIEA